MFAICGNRLRAAMAARQTAESLFSWAAGLDSGFKSAPNTGKIKKTLENFNIKIDSVGCTCQETGICEYK